MIKVEWEYYPDNICTDSPVAILKKKGTKRAILSVIECRTHHVPCLKPDYSFLNLKPISYPEEASMVRKLYDETSLSTHEILTLRLKEGCKLIEKEFFQQADEIFEKLS